MLSQSKYHIFLEIRDIITIKELNLKNDWKKLLEEFNNTFYKKSSWCKNDMNFARFVIFSHFPEIDRFIYLDWDMIVQEDIFKLEEYYEKKDKMIVANCGKQTIFSNIFTRDFRFEKNYKTLFARSEQLRRKYQTGFKLLSNFIDNPDNSHKILGFNSGFFKSGKNRCSSYRFFG